ncbi:MAG: ribosome maturation factor RimP [Actinomycetota bacterium]
MTGEPHTPGAEEAFDVTGDPSMSPVAGQVFSLLAPVVATADVELLDVDWTGGTLQVIVDHQDGVTLDQLASVNRLVSPILDQHDPISGRYTLEVSSPGVERPLRRPAHYQRAVGEVVIVKTEPHVQPRRVKGTLIDVTGDELSIDVTEIDGVDLVEVDRRTVAVEDIASARTVFEWGPTPKKGGKGANKNTQKKKQQQKKKKNEKSASPARGGGDAESDNQIEQDRKEVDDE